jgi:hypothetical protein
MTGIDHCRHSRKTAFPNGVVGAGQLGMIIKSGWS